ncbi:recombinase RecT [Photobacterium damselae]|uniref:Recombinase RecT n=1 Tax=Photobacterium damselae subsp. damselae TaxID=85581 RepID=A0AAD3ZUX0_PHODD|nr:recombinase RecT [Photobacterium damselae]KAB1179936.1 recombinase RecT [Photobacterium damselae subsp. damselae]
MINFDSIFNASAEQIKNDFETIVAEHGHTLNFSEECHHLKSIVIKSAQDPNLVSLFQATPEQLCCVLIEAAALGISLSLRLNHAMVKGEYDVNMNVTAKFHLTYRGMQKLCYATGRLEWINAWVIYEKDTVTISSINDEPEIKIPSLFGDRGQVVGSLCTLALTDGTKITTHMTIDELNACAELSKNSGWDSVFVNEFRRKQVIKRALSTMYSQYSNHIANAERYFIEYEEVPSLNDIANNNSQYRQSRAEQALNWDGLTGTFMKETPSANEEITEQESTVAMNAPFEAEGKTDTDDNSPNSDEHSVKSEPSAEACSWDEVEEESLTVDAVEALAKAQENSALPPIELEGHDIEEISTESKPDPKSVTQILYDFDE